MGGQRLIHRVRGIVFLPVAGLGFADCRRTYLSQDWGSRTVAGLGFAASFFWCRAGARLILAYRRTTVRDRTCLSAGLGFADCRRTRVRGIVFLVQSWGSIS